MNEEDLKAKIEAIREADRKHDEETFQMLKDLFGDSVVNIISIICAVIFAGLKLAAIIWLAVVVANALHVNVWLLAIALLFTVARVDINVNKK